MFTLYTNISKEIGRGVLREETGSEEKAYGLVAWEGGRKVGPGGCRCLPGGQELWDPYRLSGSGTQTLCHRLQRKELDPFTLLHSKTPTSTYLRASMLLSV